MTPSEFPSDPTGAAAFYLERGYAPLPLPPRSKKPDLNEWQNVRFTPESLDGQFDGKNIGLILGKPSGGLATVDLDSVEAYLAAPYILPTTKMRGGRCGNPLHLFYRSDDKGLRNKSFDDPAFTGPPTKQQPHGARMLEILVDGRQVVVCPSIHPNGQQYRWEEIDEPTVLNDDKMFPDQLTSACTILAAVALLGRYWPKKGKRNDAYLALCGALLRSNSYARDRLGDMIRALVAIAKDEDGVDVRLRTIESTKEKLKAKENVTGWPRLAELLGSNGSKVVQTVREWILPGDELRGPPGDPKKPVRMLPPYRGFPQDALPEPLREYVCQAALALGCDPAYLALPVLATAASAIGNTRVIQLKRGWTEPSIVWSAIVGDSGTLKSPAYLKAVAHLFAAQKQLFDEFKLAQAQFQADLQAYKEEKKKAKEDGTDPGEAPDPPVLKRIVCGDTTIEMLAVILEGNARGTLIARDELAGWLGSFTRYKGKHGGTDLPNWLELFRAGTVVVDRKTAERKTLFVPRAAASVTGGIQPGVLARALTPEFLDAGLAARILMAMPPKLPKHWTELEVAPEAEEAYHQALDRLLELDFEDRNGEKIPYLLKLSAEAKVAWIAFYEEWAAEQAAAEGEVAAALSKLEAYAARLALLHHVATCLWLEVDDRREVGVKSIEAGIALCRWFADEARRIYATLSETNEERETRRLIEFIRDRGGRITVKQLQRSNARKYPTAELAESALESLVERGQARWEERPPTAQGGRPTRECCLAVEKAPDETDETPDGPDDDGGGPAPPAPDETPGGGAEGAVSQAENEVSSVSSGVVQGTMTENSPDSAANSEMGIVGHEGEWMEGFVGQPREGNPAGDAAPPYILVGAPADLGSVVTAIDNTALVAVDLETTGLNPRSDRVRLLSLTADTIDGGTIAYLIDCFAVDPQPLLDALDNRELVFHNAEFDLPFLMRLGFTPAGTIHDTIVMSRLLTCGTFAGNDLAECVERELGLKLDKELQKADWSRPLTPEHLRYAANDVLHLGPLYSALKAKIAAAEMDKVLELEEATIPTIAWMTDSGVPFDADAWRALVEGVQTDAKRLEQELAALAPVQPDRMFSSWNFDSPDQIKQLFQLLGVTLESTDDDALAVVNHPFAGKLRDYRAARKLLTSYGDKYLAHVRPDGRIYPVWRQLGAGSGRMSCQCPNMQQMPRDPAYRRCVRATPGKVLVKADYSQIELRIAAKIADDKNMIEAYGRGDDLHSATARSVLGVKEVTKRHRQLAKALNFGLLYGMGAKGFRNYAKSNYGVDMTEDEAKRFRNAFFKAYPGLKRWHNSIPDAPVDTRTRAGRRRLNVTRFTEKLNTPVQGTGADGLKLALALLWERRGDWPGVVPVMAVHDEIVIECEAEQAEAAAAWLKQAMVDAMTPLVKPVPVEVEVKVGLTWGG